MPDSKPSSEQVVLVEDRGAVRIITMNRPDKLNALNTALVVALRDALEAADNDDNIHAVILTGAGRGFSAGADLSEFANVTGDRAKASALRSDLMARIQIMLQTLKKPVVGAVHGAAIGGGAAFAVCCDMIVAGSNLKFGYPELKHGLTPTAVLPGLQRQVGRKIAFELMSMGTLIGADEAKSLGIVNRVAPADQVLTAALEITAVWLEANPAQMTATKNMFYRMAESSFEQSLAIGRDVSAAMRNLPSDKK
jgi:enoyl-CoA hydratase